jgi:hypothetical protein
MQAIPSDPRVISALPHVPFTVPIPGMTFEEYLEYQSWRIEIQVLAMLLADKSTPKSQIINHLVAINRRATCFPVQPLPEDIPTAVVKFTSPNTRSGVLSIPMLIEELTLLLG